MANLWKVIDGEPFLINPHLAIVGNPKKGKKRMARRKVSHRRKASPPRRRRTRSYKRNSFTTAGVALSGNPPRRKRRASKRGFALNRRRRTHRKSYRRNPAILGMQLPALQTVAYVGVGFVGTPILEGFLSSFMPVSFATSTLGKYVIRLGSMLGLSYAGRKVLGPAQGNLIAIGGGLYIATSAIKEFAPGMIPGLSAYVPGIAAYQTRLSAAPGGFGAYATRLSSRGTPAGLALRGPDYGAINTTASAPNGNMNIVAQRFRRFN